MVSDSRPCGVTTRRRRRCQCGHKFTTIERELSEDERLFRNRFYIDITGYSRSQRMIMRLLARQFGPSDKDAPEP